MSNAKTRGRPKGANSFERVSLEDLQQVLGPKSVVVVSKIWMRELGIDFSAPQRQTIPVANEVSEDNAPIEFKVTSFDEE